MPIEGEIKPFLMRFSERVELSEVSPIIEGRYNPGLQVWEYSNKLSKDFPVASFPSSEKPPTTSTVVTWLAPPNLPKTDMGPDD